MPDEIPSVSRTVWEHGWPRQKASTCEEESLCFNVCNGPGVRLEGHCWNLLMARDSPGSALRSSLGLIKYEQGSTYWTFSPTCPSLNLLLFFHMSPCLFQLITLFLTLTLSVTLSLALVAQEWSDCLGISCYSATTKVSHKVCLD